MKFSIRDLLWLTLLAAVAVAWWVDREQPTNLFPFFASRPRLVKAEGVVTLKGAPLPAASVTVFYPDGNTAVGVTDAAGKFQLSFNGRAGALPGKNLQVNVGRLLSPPGGAGAGMSPTNPDPDRSIVLIDIPPKGSNQLDLRL